MKRIILGMGALLIFAQIWAFSVYGGTVFVNGTPIEAETVIINSRTLTPVRGVFEELNFEVSWNDELKSAELYNKYSKESVTIKAGEKSFFAGGREVSPDTPQTIINGRLYIPLRAVSEAVGANVEWAGSSGAVYIERDDNVVFKDEGFEKAVRKSLGLENGEPVTVKALKGIYLLNAARAETEEIKSAEDLEMLDTINDLNLSGQSITDLSPLVKHMEEKEVRASYGGEPYQYFEINISGIKNADLSSVKGLDSVKLIIDDRQAENIKGVKTAQLIIKDSGENRRLDLSRLNENLPELKQLDISEVKLSNNDDLRLLGDFDKLELPYGVSSYGRENLNEFIEDYIVFADRLEAALSAIKNAGSEYEIIKAGHDYIINNTAYDYEAYKSGSVPPEDYAAYGVILNRKGVCAGYTEAFQLLMDECGIDCITVNGEAKGTDVWESHSWNIIKTEGKYYHIDITFDDPIMPEGAQPLLTYDYFMLSDNEISPDHKWNRGAYPACG